MSLIEKYGSYEQAVKTLWQEQEEGYPGDDIARELLEYRRENNLYEYGDKIVFVDDFMHDEIMKVSDGNNVEVYMDDDRKRANIEMVRHANDNEIKENRRILSLTQLF